jgi:arylsulfatase A-like enzyme
MAEKRKAADGGEASTPFRTSPAETEHGKAMTGRRDFLKSLGGLAAASLLSPEFACRPGGDASGKPPNLVYLFADQLRRQSVGFARDARARTPSIDRLASEGVSFTNAVSGMPVCAAHRASLLTGKYPSSTGMVINELRMNPNHRSFGHVLSDAGYETGYIGKWHLWSNRAGHHEEAESSYIPPAMKRYRLGFDGYWAAYNFNHEYYRAFYFGDLPERVWVQGYEPDVQTDLAERFIRDKAGGAKPFALFVSYGVPHDPWRSDNVPEEFVRLFDGVDFRLPETWSDTPDRYMDRFTDPRQWLELFKPNLPEFMRLYYAMTASLDANIGRLMRTLENLGMARDTIVVFTSDHGEMFGAHGRVQKLTFYEEAVRVPFLVRWPGRIPAGSVRDACLGTTDIMPTLLGLMRLPIPAGVEGMDLSRVARGKKSPEPDDALLQGMGHTYLWIDGFEWRGIRNKRHTYAVYRVDGSEHLYDNLEDPLQKINRARDPAIRGLLDEFRDRLSARRRALNDTFEACTWYRDHWTDGRRNILRGAKG